MGQPDTASNYELTETEQEWRQEGDANGSDIGNYLRVKTQCGATVPDYIVIETERWSLDVTEIDAFCETLKHFAQDFCREEP